MTAPSMPQQEAAATLARVAACVRRALAAQNCREVAVALSGGVDSRFLCHALMQEGFPLLALHARGPHVPQEESRWAAAWAAGNSLALAVIDFDPLSTPEVRENGPQRCYFCKKALMRRFRTELRRRELAGEPRRLLCDGSNADDLAAIRPGLKALREENVVSPLAEAGAGKAILRAAGAATGLENPQQIARPCLLTRFAYGVSPDREALLRLAEAENRLGALCDGNGDPALGDFRLRLTPEPLLQVQRLPEALRRDVIDILRQSGLESPHIQVDEVVSGFYDAKIKT